jgi:hypothetical protein
MRRETRAKFDSVLSYPFFQACARPLEGDVVRVGSWPVALKEANSRIWENCRLMARTALFNFVQLRNWERTTEWDPIADEMRPQIVSFVESLLPLSSVPPDLHPKIRHELSWDIMLICFEYHYRDVVEPIFHLPYLDAWYATGHFPCGWDGEEFPEGWDGVIRGGRLMVF